MKVAELVAALRGALDAEYPTAVGDMAARPGVVSISVVPDAVEYETGAQCDPIPVLLTAKVVVQAATGGEIGIIDLLGHSDRIADLIRSANFTPTRWEPAEVEDQPAIEFTATADGDG